ncbi:MAG: NAD-dependent epimerase/dehydratase family protein [Intestinibacter sp.]|uniref:NAD-dependent epimerase/dehydratase family protein n=1 Tax=Intestinibacter sp. TaxID=1965304 RepID=UPI003F15D517
MESVLIMGGSDFIGKSLAKYFIGHGHKVDVLTTGKIDYEGVNKHFSCNRRKEEELKNALKDNEYTYIYDMTAFLKSDIAELIQFVNRDTLKKYVVLSSAAVYKNTGKYITEDEEKGVNPAWGKYGIEKVEAEKYITESDIPYIIIRPTHIYGPENNLYREVYFFDRIKEGKAIPVPSDRNEPVVNQFIYIDDFVKVLYSLTKNDIVREAYNVSTPQLVTWKKLIETCGEIIGKEPIIKYVNSDKIKVKDRSYFPFRNTSCVLEIDKLIDHGLYTPNILIEKGLKKTYKWYVKNKPKMEDPEMVEVDQVLKIV